MEGSHEQPADDSIAVALSGGGHRAALFGLGVLLYLVDARKNGMVSCVSSVSGGSLTNGFVGKATDYRSVAHADFVANTVRPFVGQVVRNGTLFAPTLTKIYLAVLVIVLLVAMFGPAALPTDSWLLKSVVLVISLCLWGGLFALRGRVFARALRHSLFSAHGQPIRLRELHDAVCHVLCATDIRAGEQVYLSSRFVYGYRLGHGIPADLELDRAVQASAGFPGGFPPTWIPTRRHKFVGPPSGTAPGETKWLVLLDGGLYDNMGEQWAAGFRERVKAWPELSSICPEPTELIVVNAAPRMRWTEYRRGIIPVVSEIAALIRTIGVLYRNTTTVRRRELVARFDSADKAGTGLRGALIQIDRSPFYTAEYFLDDEVAQKWPGRAQRAATVLRELQGESKETWESIATANAKMPTSLRRIPLNDALRLLRHAYVLAMCNLHVVLGYPIVAVPTDADMMVVCEGASPGS